MLNWYKFPSTDFTNSFTSRAEMYLGWLSSLLQSKKTDHRLNDDSEVVYHRCDVCFSGIKVNCINNYMLVDGVLI